MRSEPTTLQEAVLYFGDPDNCLSYIVSRRWPIGVTCPTCGRHDVGYLAKQSRWQCKGKHPKRQFSAKVGTIFEDSALGLDKWLVAVWMVANCKNGVSSYEIARSLGITQKSAWHMVHRIRLAMQTGTFKKLSGEVEIDETFIGGRARFMHKSRRAKKVRGTGGIGKAAVMGLLERHGPDGHSVVTLKMVPTVRRNALMPEVKEQVTPGAEVFTDALPSYKGLAADYIHNVIDHAESYAEGKVHTNGLENFWSLLKRGIKGTYVSVEPFHLFRYLDEQSFRFNRRKASDAELFSAAVRGVVGHRVTWEQVTGKDAESLSGLC